jgi:hypothetical protein
MPTDIPMRRTFSQTSILLLSLSLGACGYDNDGKPRVSTVSTAELTYSSIDTDAQMTDLETGVGMFVEYAAGGKWTVRFACDTATSRTDCFWDVYAYTPLGRRIYSYELLGYETEDYALVSSDGEIRLQPKTTTDLDGISFVVDKGEPITFDVYLNDVAFPNDFMFWMSDGKVVQGAQSTVVELTPTEP